MSENKVVIGATLRADGTQANETVKSFKAELREAKENLIQMQTKFGEFSNEAKSAAKRVAELKDQIGDANSLVAAFNPDKKFAAFGQAISGVTGGFSALQGTLALVGAEGKEVEEAMLKVQSAMAIQQGIDAVLDSVQGFKNLGAVIKETTLFRKADAMATKAAAFAQGLFSKSVDTTSTSFKFLKGAIAATGIGVLIVLVGEAVSWFNKLTSAAEEAAEAEKKALEMRDAANDADFAGAMSKIDSQEKLWQSRLKAQGAGEDKIFQDRLNAQKDRIAQTERLLNQKGISDELRGKREKQLLEARHDLEIMQNERIAEQREKSVKHQVKTAKAGIKEKEHEITEEKRLAQQRIDAAKQLVSELQKINGEQGLTEQGKELYRLQNEFNEKRAILLAGHQSTLELEKWFQDQSAAIKKKYREEEIKEGLAARDAAMEAERKVAAEKAALQQKQVNDIIQAAGAVVTVEGYTSQQRIDLLNESEQKLLADRKWTGEERLAIETAFADARKKIDEAEAESKVKLAQATSGTLTSLGNLAGQQTALGKVLGAASATIDTYVGASKALAQGGIFGKIAAIGIIAQGLANVRRIASVQVPKSGGLSVPSVNSAAPSIPQTPQNTITALDRNTINQIGNQAIRSFVIEADVTNNQDRIRRINRAARIGVWLLPFLGALMDLV